MIPVMFGITLIVFIAMRLVPGDPIVILFGADIDPVKVDPQAIRDRPGVPPGCVIPVRGARVLDRDCPHPSIRGPAAVAADERPRRLLALRLDPARPD